MKNFNERVQKAAKNYLSRRGFEIVEQNWESPDSNGGFDIVAIDEGALVFVTVKGRDGSKRGFAFDDASLSRDEFETLAMQFLAEHADEYVDCAVRFDVVSITVISEDRAMIRHHVNAMSINDFEEE